MTNGGTARYWILTIPQYLFTPYQPPSVAWIRGQLERGEGGFLHWQLSVTFTTPIRLSGVRRIFGNAHAEPTRSRAAEQYAFKEATRVEGTQFELGRKPFQRSNKTDWETVWEAAKSGNAGDIPADIRVRCYSQIRRIGYDYMAPHPMERTCIVYWGATGVGKSRRAWDEAGFDSYPKGNFF